MSAPRPCCEHDSPVPTCCAAWVRSDAGVQEDLPVRPREIESLFGAAVAGMVWEVTDDKTLDKKGRKKLQIEHAASLSDGAKLIKLADKISNLHSLAASPPVERPTDQRRPYVKLCRDVVAGLRGANTILEARFDKAAEAAGKVHQQAV
jgi:(p)ppGpp synthase/HD superfamily hydrolase